MALQLVNADLSPSCTCDRFWAENIHLIAFYCILDIHMGMPYVYLYTGMPCVTLYMGMPYVYLVH